MNAVEFGAYVERSIPDYARDKVDSGQWAKESALELSRQEFEKALPEGTATPDNFLFTVRDAATQETVGMLWYAVQERAGNRIAYVFDVLVEPPYQRRGYGVRIFEALETEVRSHGLCGIALHVFGHNTAARALYAKLGYQTTNLNLFKEVSTPDDEPARSCARVSSAEVRIASPADRLPIRRMLELYQHDLSDVWDQDLDAHGEYGYALDRYWDSEGFHPFVVVVEGKYAGFALVNQAVRIGTEGYWMDQFFVLKKYRGQGVGEVLARSAFAALPGRWEVGQMPENVPAQGFWRKVITSYTGGRFVEHMVRAGWWQGVIQVFESGAAP